MNVIHIFQKPSYTIQNKNKLLYYFNVYNIADKLKELYLEFLDFAKKKVIVMFKMALGNFIYYVARSLTKYQNFSLYSPYLLLAVNGLIQGDIIFYTIWPYLFLVRERDISHGPGGFFCETYFVTILNVSI